MATVDQTLPEDFARIVQFEADELIAEFQATTPDEIRKVAEGLAASAARL